MYRIDTAKSDVKSAKILLEAEEIRHASDYDDFYIATREEAEELIERVENYIKIKLV